MSQLPAEVFRLKDRGVLKVGAVADVVVFDPVKVNDPSTFEDPHHYAEGFSAVLVNGVPVIDQGVLTGQRPGRVVRREE
jgi:N-acyl-D-amino-acid deacylase